MSERHPFDEAMQLTALGGGRFRGATSPHYANMLGPFGGTINAVMLNAVLEHPDRLGDPLALTVNFAAPIVDGRFEIRTRAVRTGRSTQHWSIELMQGEDIQVTGTAITALRRESWSSLEADRPSNLPPPEALPRLAAAGMAPWLGCYDLRFIEGELPMAPGDGREHATTKVWFRDDPPRPLTYASLAALCDGFFPRVFLRLGRRVPASTITMTSTFHADAALLAAQGDRHVLGIARGLNYRNGFFDQVAELWSPGGEMLASSHQTVFFKA